MNFTTVSQLQTTVFQPHDHISRLFDNLHYKRFPERYGHVRHIFPVVFCLIFAIYLIL